MSTEYAYDIGVGDLEPPLEVALSLNGAPFVLNAGTDVVTMEWRRPDGTREVAAMTIADAPSGLVRKTWSAGETDLAGVHRFQVLVARAGRQRTFPSDPSTFAFRINAGV